MPTAKKTAEKTAKPSGRNGNVLPVGAHAANSGGKKGRSGRPTLAFKNFLAQLRDDPKVRTALHKTLKDNASRHYAAALKVIVDYDDQLPANRLTPEERAAKIAEIERRALARKQYAESVAP